MDLKKKAFQLFAQGKLPGDPEVQALGKPKTLREYYRLYQKSQGGSSMSNANSDNVVRTAGVNISLPLSIARKEVQVDADDIAVCYNLFLELQHKCGYRFSFSGLIRSGVKLYAAFRIVLQESREQGKQLSDEELNYRVVARI